MITVNKSET